MLAKRLRHNNLFANISIQVKASARQWRMEQEVAGMAAHICHQHILNMDTTFIAIKKRIVIVAELLGGLILYRLFKINQYLRYDSIFTKQKRGCGGFRKAAGSAHRNFAIGLI